MARLNPKGGGVAARKGGSHLKMALLGLVVLGAVLGMLNMAPPSLHAELHSSSTRKELRELTGEAPPQRRSVAAAACWQAGAAPSSQQGSAAPVAAVLPPTAACWVAA